MNGHTPPPDSLLSNGTVATKVTKTRKAMPEADISHMPQAQAAPPTEVKSIAGVQVEASGQVLSISAAMQQGLLSPGLGLALLQAQAATGGLVDPAKGQLLSVSEALCRGLVGLELKEKLLAAERAVTGYPDPYGGNKLPLFQAIGKEVVDRELGRSWLEAQLATGGLVDPVQGVCMAPEIACQRGLLDQETWHNLEQGKSRSDTTDFCDPNTLEQLSYRELLGRCVKAPGTALPLLPLKTTFRTLSGAVSTAELLEAGILDEATARGLQEGQLAVPEVSMRADVQRYLLGTGSVAGLVLLPNGHKKSLCQAAAEHLLPLGTALPLLEAQAATHSLVDPATGRKLCVDEAIQTGLVGPELYGQLLVAEQAVTGFHDPFSGLRVPLFQAMQKGLVDEPLALRLLDAQLTTGGVVCPARRLRLPLEAALRFGCLDEDTWQRVSQTAGFSDPSTQENVSYGQLLSRCVTDPETGLAFLPLLGGTQKDKPQGPQFIAHSTCQALSVATATVSAGKFQGHPVPLWQLLFSEAIPVEQRALLAQQYKEGTLSLETLAGQLKAAVEKVATEAKVTFPGLRDAVTPGELLESTIIDQEMYEQLERGQATARDVGQRDEVQRYLLGTGSVAGLLLEDSQERLSIYEARSKGLLRPGTALVLLEAQAATGFIIDPKENKRFSVEEALKAGIIGPDIYAKLLSAERAVTGYTDPYTGEQISLFQAMQKDLIVRDHGLRLLEAQIATGGIIDPVHSHRVPVEVAYQRGYFDRALNLVLSDPGDDTKGFFDPNTHENLTYLQLLGRCVRDPHSGLQLLPLSSPQPQLVDSATRRAFQGQLLEVQYGRFRGRLVSLWELVNSEYVCEDWRRQLLRQFRLRRVTLEQVTARLQVASRRWVDLTLPTLRGRIHVHELLEAGVIDEKLLDRVLSGALSPESLLQMDAVWKCLRGSGALSGVLLQPSGRRLSLYQAMQQQLLGPGVGLALLEAQVATGALLDPHSQEALTVDEAVRRGLVGPELYGQLQRAEGAVTGFRDPFSGKRVSMFQAMKKGLVPVEQATRLLEAQVATGGVIDPIGCYHLPMAVATKRGYIDQETGAMLSGTPHTFPSPDGRGLTSYAQVLEQCPRDEASGLPLLPLLDSAPAVLSDKEVQEALQAAPGAEDGRSLWDLLRSQHFTEEQRQAFKEDFRAGHCSEQQLREALLSWLRSAELRACARVSLPGPRGEVPAVWLLDAGIISQDMLEALAQGQQSPEAVAMQPEVKACLWGTGCVAGVLLKLSGAKASITRAVQDGLLPEGLGQRLLEAQVACGALLNPVTNQRLSVEDAVKAGLVDGELNERLQLTQKAVTGFPDPCSGRILSLWQAIERGLVSRDEGLPLLQAQLATGGALDPVYQVHLPLPAACRLGLLDEATSQALSSSSEDVKFFFDPSAQEKVTYQELRARCIQEATTSLWLLPLSQDMTLCVDEHTAVALRSMKVPVGTGRFKGQAVSLWDLLLSEYVDPQQRGELAALCQSGRAAALRDVVQAVTAAVTAAETQPPAASFPGLRKQVSAGDLFRSQLIDKKTLDELTQGKRTVQEVTQMASVQRFLEGGNFIAGVRIQATGETMSVPEALRRGLLRPGTALVLLEAQAATGFIIDPVKNRKLTVEQAYSAGMFNRETYEKLLSAERAVTGYTDPYTGEQISLFQAMQRDLIVRDHGLRLLEAQIATGGIIDPVHSHRVPVEVAYQRGYFDEDLNRVLEDPSDDTKGFFDPNTHENLTYLQLLGRCVEDPDTGLYMLQIVKKGEAYVYVDEATRHLLESHTTKLHVGRFAGQTTSLWEVLSSQYFTEDRRRELVHGYKTERLSLEGLQDVVRAAVEEMEQQSQAVEVVGPQGPVSAAELFSLGIIDRKTLDMLHRDTGREQGLQELARAQRFLEGQGCIAGVTLSSTQEVLDFYEATRRKLIPMGTALQLLEAQAATGFLLDPRSYQKLRVDEAVSAGLVGTELKEQLLRAEKAATGHTDKACGARLPLFQAMQQKLVPREQALPLLEVQVATGGVIDPTCGHRVPLVTAFQRRLLNQDTYALVSDQALMRKRFVDPSTRDSVTYQQLQARCHTDANTGWLLLPMANDLEDCGYMDEATRRALEDEWVDIKVGRYKGQRWSVWQLLNSEYLTEEKKQDLVRRYKQDTRRELRKVVQVILDLIAEKEKTQRQLWFQGIRRQVTASELKTAKILTDDDLQALEKGQSTVEDILKQDQVKGYLQGTSCIAGVLVPRREAPGGHEKMSIYQAMWKGVLRPGTALVLLEAQAATGFVIDPVANRRLSVEEAVAEGVVGGEVREKLLSAERAVTGYTDPYTGEQISLFQAMQRDLIVRDHGLRLLEAQIATGGIIDPVHSHRVPVEVAYQRGYFDEDLNRVLEDPGDDTKGFFDPNTHENLTYLQLLGRCVEDPDTGLYMLQLADPGAPVHQLGEELRAALRGARVTPGWGALRGRSVSVWELLFHREVPESRRHDLLVQFRAGQLTAQDVGAALTALLDLRGGLRASTVEVRVGRLRGRAVPIWDVLASSYVSVGTREELLAQFDSGALDVPGLARRLTAIIEEAESSARSGHGSPPGPETQGQGSTGASAEEDLEGAAGGAIGDRDTRADAAAGRRQEQQLRAATMQLQVGRFRGRAPSIWEVLWSSYVSASTRQDLLAQFGSGGLALPGLIRRLTTIVEEAEGCSGPDPRGPQDGKAVRGPCPSPGAEAETGTGADAKADDGGARQRQERALRAAAMQLGVGQFRGQSPSVWDVLWSSYVSVSTREDLLAQHAAGALALPALVAVLTQVVEETEDRLSRVSFPGLRRQVSASELGVAKILEPETLRELAQGTKTLQEVTEMEAVKRYLQGTSCIAGVLVPRREAPGGHEKMSIYQAMWKGVLRPGTALVLLEAQAATGFVIDPVANRRLSVEEAVAEGVVGGEVREKLLSAERAVTGYTDPYTGEQISLFQAMQRDLIVRDHGLRLLEAQIATGGIIDPVHSHRVPVEVAYQRGYFDEDLNRVLEDPGDDTKGFFDPNTHENLTYLQLLGRCVEDPDTGLYMLQLADPGAPVHQLGEELRAALRGARVTPGWGALRGRSVSVWELLFHREVPESRRHDLLVQFRAGQLTAQDVGAALTALLDLRGGLRASTVEVRVGRLRGRAVPIWDVLASSYVSVGTREELLAQFDSGALDVPGLARRLTAIIEEAESSARSGHGSPPGPETQGQGSTGASAEEDLEGAAGGAIGDRDTRADAAAGRRQEQQLRAATMQLQVGRFRGRAPSVWEVLWSSYVSASTRQDLLAQFGSGGLALPGLIRRLTTIVEEAEGCSGPDPRGPQDGKAVRGPCPSPGAEAETGTGADAKADDGGARQRQERALRAAAMQLGVGQFRGQSPSVWDVLWSSYVSVSTREDLLAQHAAGALALPALVAVLTQVVEETEDRLSRVSFPGLRRQVSASELGVAKILEPETLRELAQGTKTLQEVTEMEAVKRYLQGTSCIAGVLVPRREAPGGHEKMSIYQAMWKGVLRPGTALVLLEAQAATGFVIDPVANRRLSVEEAVAEGVVGGEVREKLLSAERAVTGYTDPYTGEQISLFQAMQRDLIVRDHGLRLLEAQIATGGIIDPVHSHRVPVEVAYQRGYFDEDLNRVLEDPGDDTKGFFDPNTHENLTYLQLLGRCVEDPDTGLYMLQLADPGAPVHQLGEELRAALRGARVTPGWGALRGRSVSVWELLFHREVPESRRHDLLVQFRAGQLTAQDVGAALTALLDLRGGLRASTVEVRVGRLRGRAVPIWDVLASSYVSVGTREELLAQFDLGALDVPGLARRLTAIIEEAESSARSGHGSPPGPETQGQGSTGASAEEDLEGAAGGAIGDRDTRADAAAGRRQEQQLRAATMQLQVGRFRGRAPSVWEVLWSSYVSASTRQDLLAQFGSGGLALPGLIRRLTTIVEEAEGCSGPDPRGPQDGKAVRGPCPSPGAEAETGTGADAKADDGGARQRQERALRAAAMQLGVGQFRGQSPSVWDVLWSSYVSVSTREDLLAQHAAGALALPALVAVLTQVVEETEDRLSRVSFPGLRRQVSASELGVAKILEPETLRELAQGTKTLQEVTEMEAVKRYLQGTSCIAGVLVPRREAPGGHEKMSIYQAMWKGVLRPGTALVLLEAQAATGFVIDPVANRRLSVEEAVAEGVVGGEVREKLLSAERAVTGYTDPYTGEQISLFQAMQRDLIVRDHGLRLLEAQIATGGIIDPVHSHRVPVEVAYQRGYFDEDLNRVLEDPGDDTKGFFDPNTHENLTYLQLLGRCVEDPDTGLYMLQLADPGAPVHQLGEELRAALRGARVTPGWGALRGRSVSVWELLFHREVPESRRHDLLVQFRAGQLTVQDVGAALTALLDLRGGLRASTVEVRVGRLRGRAVPIWDVLASSYVSVGTREELLAQFDSGALDVPGLARRLTAIIEEAESSARSGHGSPPGPETQGQGSTGASAEEDLEGAAGGAIGDRDTRADAAAGRRQEQQLRAATMQLQVGRFRGRAPSVWEVLWSSYVSASTRQDLLAQFGSGGLALPGLIRRLTTIVEEAEGCSGPDPRGPQDGKAVRGPCPSPGAEAETGTGADAKADDGGARQRQERALRAAAMQLGVGQFRGQSPSVWDVLWSSYVSVSTREDLLAQHAAGALALPALVAVLTQVVEETEDRLSRVSFPGLRRQVSASELGVAKILEPETLRELAQGTKTLQEVTEMEAVKRYLQGTSCIAGVLVPRREAPGGHEKMSIYQAMWKGVLRPGTALVLLEAQAATGFVIDPVANRRLSVEEAVAEGVVGGEVREKLLSAERAVTGYTDPYTGEQISLFQAMQRDLIVRDHGLRLLEAQIATGGIIDPVHSHRVPVEVAYQRGYFDEDLNRVLEDPGDDTKGFFDPNTHENLTYLQLLGRCVEDPDTGLYMLQLADPGAPVHQLGEELRAALRGARVTPGWGALRGRSVSVWELLFHREVPESRRHDLLVQFRAGQLTAQDVGAALTALLDLRGGLRASTVEVRVGRLRGRAVPIWDVLASSYVSVGTREELLAQFDSGALDVPGLARRLTAIIEEAESSARSGHGSPPGPETQGQGSTGASAEEDLEGAAGGAIGDRDTRADAAAGCRQEQQLRAATMQLQVGRFRGRAPSVWEVLWSSYVSASTRQDLLAQFGSGGLALPGLIRRLTTIVEEAEGCSGPDPRGPQDGKAVRGPCPSPGAEAETGTGADAKADDGGARQRQERALRAAAMQLGVGQFRGQSPSVWDVLWSSYVSVSTREDLLAQHAAGALALPALVAVLTQVVEETEDRLSRVSFPGLRRQVSASELGVAKILEPETLRELAQGTKTLQEVTEMEAVKRYLQGTSCIAGVLVPRREAPGGHEKMSIYQAMWKGVLRPGTALVLLEAQAATGFVIDPVANRRLSVEEAVAEGVVGGEVREKLLSAERAVTGYTDPYTGEQISLFQAMQRDLIVRDHGLRLLEAQIATGGIIDPVHSHRVPVEVAYQRGYFDEDLNRVLEDPGDDTKGFFDPNTHENLTYLQLLGRCVEDPDTGLYMLQLADPGAPVHQLGEELRAALRGARVTPGWGALRGRSVSVWELLFHREVPESRRHDLLVQFRAGQLTAQDVGAALTALLDLRGGLRASTVEVRVGRLRGRAVPIWDVLASSYVSVGTREELLAQFDSGALDVPGLARRLTAIIEEAESSARSGHGSPPGPETQGQGSTGASAEEDLEGAAGGAIGDRDTRADAAAGRRQEQQLRAATMQLQVGRFRGRAPSVWEVLWSSYVSASTRQDLLAQFGSGGLALPGLIRRLTTIVEEAEGCSGPDPRGPQDGKAVRGPCPSPGAEAETGTGADAKADDGGARQRQERALRAAAMQLGVGQFRGQSPSVWDVLWSSYVSVSTREDLLAQHAAGALALPALVAVLTQVVEETEDRLSRVSFPGLRRQVSASELGVAKILEPETLRELAQGTKTLQEVTEMEAVKRYLQGTSCIAGVLVPRREAPGGHEKMSIYQAMWKGVLRPGTALVLLEAQAATGFVIDPVANRRLSVEEAVAEGVVGGEVREKLLSAERAVTGYTDPYTGEQISLFQAMQKDLIVRDHGLRLLEAQIATGGIIDPVHSHRVPVEVAYQRGYFDEDLNRVLEDPGDDTKGFFDPNTHENLTYLQLLDRCVEDPDTGLMFLSLSKEE